MTSKKPLKPLAKNIQPRNSQVLRNLAAAYYALCEFRSNEQCLEIESQVDVDELQFMDHLAGMTFRIVRSMRDSGTPIDLKTFASSVKGFSSIDFQEEVEISLLVAEGVVCKQHYKEYLEYYLDAACQIRAMKECERLSSTIDHLPRLEIAEEFRKSLAVVEVGSLSAVNDESMKDVALAYMDELESRCKNETTSMVSSPWEGFNRRGGGFFPSCYVAIGAFPNVGKTALAIDLCRHLGGNLGMPVEFFSFESYKKKVMERLTSSVSGIPTRKLRDPKTLGEREVRLVSGAVSAIAGWPITIHDDSSRMYVEWIANKMREAKKKRGARVAIVDYAQLVKIRDRKESREQQVAYISSHLKEAQRETGMMLFLLSQLNKDGDTRESMSIEQDADDIFKLREKKDKQEIKLIDVPKRRDEERGYTFVLEFETETGRFNDILGPI